MYKNFLIIFGLITSLTIWINTGRYAQAYMNEAYYDKYNTYIEKADAQLDIYTKRKYQKKLAKIREQNRIAHERFMVLQKKEELKRKQRERLQQIIARQKAEHIRTLERQRISLANQLLLQQAEQKRKEKIAEQKYAAALVKARLNILIKTKRRGERESRRSRAS